MKNLLIICSLFMLTVTGCATQEAQLQTAVNLTPEHFKNTATLTDDPLDTFAKITTVNGFQEKKGLLGVVLDDNFIRAHINKKTGQASFQVYQTIPYEGGWRFYETANFETPSGPKSISATIIARDVNCTGYCTYNEHVAFNVDEKLLRLIASEYQQGQLRAWKFKFLPKSGRDFNSGILPNEINGILKKVDEYRASRGITPTVGR